MVQLFLDDDMRRPIQIELVVGKFGVLGWRPFLLGNSVGGGLPALVLERSSSLGIVELFLDDDLRRPIQGELDWARMGVFFLAYGH